MQLHCVIMFRLANYAKARAQIGSRFSFGEMIMDVKNFRLDELKPYEKNARNNDGAVDAVANSIETFGFKVPIVIDAYNVIVCGHTRYRAAQKLKLKTVPCVVRTNKLRRLGLQITRQLNLPRGIPHLLLRNSKI